MIAVATCFNCSCPGLIELYFVDILNSICPLNVYITWIPMVDWICWIFHYLDVINLIGAPSLSLWYGLCLIWQPTTILHGLCLNRQPTSMLDYINNLSLTWTLLVPVFMNIEACYSSQCMDLCMNGLCRIDNLRPNIVLRIAWCDWSNHQFCNSHWCLSLIHIWRCRR